MERAFLKQAKNLVMWHRSKYDRMLFLTSPMAFTRALTLCLLSQTF